MIDIDDVMGIERVMEGWGGGGGSVGGLAVALV
jgi:hypothetical protein